MSQEGEKGMTDEELKRFKETLERMNRETLPKIEQAIKEDNPIAAFWQGALFTLQCVIMRLEDIIKEDEGDG